MKKTLESKWSKYPDYDMDYPKDVKYVVFSKIEKS